MNAHNHSHGHTHDLEVKQVSNLSPTEVKLTLSFAADIIQSHLNQTSQRYSQVAKIPGFRAGKAPLSMVKEKYKEDIQKEVISHLVEAGIYEAVEKTKLTPINRPKFNILSVSFDGTKPLEFEVQFEIQPEIELKSYKGIKLKKTETEIKDEEVQKTLDGLRQRYAYLEPTDATKPEKGLYAIVQIGFETLEEKPETQVKESYTVEVGTGALFDFLEKPLLEMSLGESKEFEAEFPSDFPDKKFAGKKAKFQFHLEELKKKTLPELDDAFASQIQKEFTLAKLKEEIIQSLKTSKEQESRDSLRQQVMEFLVQKNPIEVPKSMVDRQSVMLLNSILEEHKRRGEKLPELKDEQIESVRKSAERMVKGSLLLREVAKKENIQLDEGRVSEKIETLAKRNQKQPEEIKALLEKEKALSQIEDEALTDQVFDFLINNASSQAAP